mgnify:CR=1 FL=1
MATTTYTLFKLPSGDKAWVSANWDDPDGAVVTMGPTGPGFESRERWIVQDFKVRDVGNARGALARLIEPLGAGGYGPLYGPLDLTADDIADWASIEEEEETEE